MYPCFSDDASQSSVPGKGSDTTSCQIGCLCISSSADSQDRSPSCNPYTYPFSEPLAVIFHDPAEAAFL